MGLYQQAGNAPKTLEMARAVLKFDPANAVGLLAAAQTLAEGARNQDLDRDARLDEAAGKAHAAVEHAPETLRPAGLTKEQYAADVAQLRGAAHAVMGTVAFKKGNYAVAIREYGAAAAVEKEQTDPVIWLRLAMAHEKTGDFASGLAAAQNAIAGSAADSPVRTLAEKEKTRLEQMRVLQPLPKPSEAATPATAASGEPK